MKHKIYKYLIILIINSYLLSFTSEMFFKTINYGDGTGSVTITAVAVEQVYWDNGQPTNAYDYKTTTIPADGGTYNGFDLLDFNSGIPNNPDVTLGMGLYKIEVDDDYFYWDTRDCNLFDSNPPGTILGSPDLLIVIDLYNNNEVFDSYDYGSEGMSGGISSGNTIPVWWTKFENADPDYHPYNCWDETRLVLINIIDDSNAGGYLGTDLTGLIINSGGYDYVPKNIERTILTEIELQYQSNTIYHTDWELDNSNKTTSMPFTPNSTIEIEANFKEKNQCDIYSPLSSVNISIMDPWWNIENNEPSGFFHELSSSNYNIFIGEGDLEDPNNWAYAVSVPYAEYTVGPSHYVFSGWETVNADIAPYPGENELTKKVLFIGANAVVKAHYIDINAVEGKIFNDFTLSGNRDIVGNLIVGESGDLTISNGSIMSVSPNKKIDVYGELHTQGATFTRSDPNSNSKTYWAGIDVKPGGEVHITSSTVEGAAFGISGNNAEFSIINSTIRECMFGVYLLFCDNTYYSHQNLFTDNTTGLSMLYSTVSWDNNTFSNNSQDGIKLIKSYGSFTSNTITNNGTGIYAGNNTGISLNTFNTPSTLDEENNIITQNNNYGVYIDQNSTPILGDYWVNWKGYTYGGFNRFNNPGAYDVYNQNNTTIKAKVNWWDTFNNYGPVSIHPSADELGGGLPPPKPRILA